MKELHYTPEFFADLTLRAMAAGVDIEKHRCTCEVCWGTSVWCPGSISSVVMEVEEREKARRR